MLLVNKPGLLQQAGFDKRDLQNTAIPQAEVFDVSAAGFTPVFGVRQIRKGDFGASGAVAAHTSGPVGGIFTAGMGSTLDVGQVR
jgi:hypothetical protein